MPELAATSRVAEVSTAPLRLSHFREGVIPVPDGGRTTVGADKILSVLNQYLTDAKFRWHVRC
jgi:hypothetical protein